MQVLHNVFTALSFIGFVQGVVVITGLLLKYLRTKQVFLLLLMFLVTAMSLENLRISILRWEVYLQFEPLAFFTASYGLAMGPLIWLYFKYFLNQEKTFNKWDLLHFIPYLIEFLHYPFLFNDIIQNPEAMQQRLDEFRFGAEFSRIQIGIVLSAFIYILLAYINFYKSYKKITPEEKQRRKWLMRFITTLAILEIYFMAVVLLDNFVFNNQLPYALNYPISIYISFFIYFVGYNQWLFQPESLAYQEAKGQLKQKETELNREHLQKLANKAVQLMEDEKYYLDASLTASTFAQKLNMSTRQLTNVLNKQLNQNFSQFTNGFRVEEFKRKVANKEHLEKTILALALESGFNSKSTFNRIFTQTQGIKPSEYIAEQEK